MSTSILGLPPIPSELKPITSFIQRAEELKNQDKVISYWCAYYAAQVGIGLKARDSSSRDFLFTLLGTLERMKSDIGQNDAIDIESVSAAYVENFALKVFANADNEDRNGRSTRSTAKKFLAAANFLELLNTFPKSDISESNEDKIRYAKWKAADIAKAFREGRKPTSGPPGWAEEQEELKRLQKEEEEQHIPPAPTFMPNVPSNLTLTSPSHVAGASPPRSTHSIISSSPPKRSSTSSSPPRSDVGNKPSEWSHPSGDVSDAWSTAATMGRETPGHPPSSAYATGTPGPSTAGHDWTHGSPPRSGRSSDKQNQDASNRIRSASGGSSSSNHTTGEVKRASSSSPTKSSFKSGSPDSDKRVHFADSTSASPPASPSKHLNSISPKEYTGPSSIYAPSPHPASPPTVVYPIPPPPLAPQHSPPRSYIYGPPASSQGSPPRATARYPLAPPPEPEFELTPEIIAKAQKRCRFAISALDYEDVEQAKKELRAALALLGE